MSITVDVRDDSLPYWPTDSAVYYPKHHRFSDWFRHPDPSLEIVDVVETWKGLQPHHAQELRFWQNAFKTAVGGLVEEALLESYRKAGIAMELFEGESQFSYTRHLYPDTQQKRLCKRKSSSACTTIR